MIHLAPAIAVLLAVGSAPPPLDVRDAARAGTLGLIAGPDGWVSPLELVKREADDARLAATRLEYARLRASASPGLRDQIRLADWCERAGLVAEAQAHLTAASRKLPDDAGLHARLGERLYHGVWMSQVAIDAEAAEAKAQANADDLWAPRLAAWHDDLADPTRRLAAARALDEVRDARAVPSIRWSFGDAQGWEQAWAARLLGRIDSPRSTRELARLAIFGIDPPVRSSALERLVVRDPRSFVGLLINWLHEPIRFQAATQGGDRSPALLRVEGDRSIVERSYDPYLVDPTSRNRGRDVRSGPFQVNLDATQAAALEERERRAVAERQGQDVRTLLAANAKIERTNARVTSALVRATGEDFGQAQEPWTIWWTAELGYAYQSPAEPLKPYVSESLPVPVDAPPPPPVRVPVAQAPAVQGPVHHSCFGAGTPVLTRTGSRAIEKLRVGDQVLSQDPADGSLEFRPILAVFHNAPTRTLRVEVESETILATPIHRFWVAGKGWVMARDLKAGDAVRSVGATATVRSVRPHLVMPVFNLEVAGGHSFFVGSGNFLVHDNSLVAPTDRPFDRPGIPSVAAIRSGR